MFDRRWRGFGIFGVKTRMGVMGASFDGDSFRGDRARAEASPQGDSPLVSL